jgi:murein DD-endopeptidase MepM/ murein hydrolase activator NlpD
MRPLLLSLCLLLSSCVPREDSSAETSPAGSTMPEAQEEPPPWEPFTGYLYMHSLPPDEEILMPVRGVRVRQVADTFGAPRSGGRRHEGQDIFAPRGTPVYSATGGVVLRMGYGQLGGNFVYVLGPGGRRYYYAHLEAYARGLEEGQEVTPSTLLGYVGNTGNARTTPPHLHFGVYGSRWRGDERVINPLVLLKDRDWKTLGKVEVRPAGGAKAPPAR